MQRNNPNVANILSIKKKDAIPIKIEENIKSRSIIGIAKNINPNNNVIKPDKIRSNPYLQIHLLFSYFLAHIAVI